MQQVIVSNSSPIIHLAKIGHLALLHDFFGEVLIPEAVHDECLTSGKGRPEIDAIKQASWLRVRRTTNQDLVRLLNADIDRGEAEAIGLAIEQQAGLILLDDADAREKARLYQLKITGTIGLLLQAKNCGKLASLSATLQHLRATGFWLNDALTRRLLLEAGE